MAGLDGVSSEPPLGLFRARVAYLRRGNRRVRRRIAMPIREIAQRNAPRIPTSGRSLAVFGSFFGAGSAAAASTGAGAGADGAYTMRSGTSAFGSGGGGGIFPVLLIS